MTVLYIMLLFFSGSLMFSQWIGLLLKKDLTRLNDGNPGASNLWQSAGAGWGLLAVFLDFMKGYLPLAILIWTKQLTGYILIPAAVAPILGHAFSPFQKFKGGKCKTVSFGVWSALTDFEISIAYAVILAFLQVLIKLFCKKNYDRYRLDAFTATVGMLLVGPYLFMRKFPLHIIIIWLLNILIFIYVNRAMLWSSIKSTNKKSEEKPGKLSE